MLDTAKDTLFPRNHQDNHKKSATYQQITTKSTVNYKLLTVNNKLLFPGGLIPHNHGDGFQAPPTLERSGYERRGGAVTYLALLERARAWDLYRY